MNNQKPILIFFLKSRDDLVLRAGPSGKQSGVTSLHYWKRSNYLLRR